MKNRSLMLIGIILIFSLACQLFTSQQRTEATPNRESAPTAVPFASDVPKATVTGNTFEDEKFSFTMPKGWKTHEEVWGTPMLTGQNYYGLGVTTVVTIQFPGGQGKGRAFFSVATSPLAGGVDLEERFTKAYTDTMPEIVEASRGTFTQNGLSGFEIIYDRPWGEPWWTFHDIWLEKDAVIYVLSFHSLKGASDDYADVTGDLVSSFQFR